jgi:heptosyltransferase-2
MSSVPEKILVLRLSSIGDILLTTPLLRVLHARFPQSRIDYCIKERFQPLLAHHPYLQRIWTFPEGGGFKALMNLRRRIREEKYDVILDLHRNQRSWLLRDRRSHVTTFPKYYLRRWLLVRLGWNLFSSVEPVHRRYLQALKPWRITDDGQGLEFVITEDEKAFGQRYLKEAGAGASQSCFALAVGASYETKQWPAESFAQLAQRLIARYDARIILFGADKERVTSQKVADLVGDGIINATGMLDIRQTASVMAATTVVVANDSGLMHLAVALQKKTVAIFGSTTRELGFFPQASFSRVVENRTLSCRPCSHVGKHRCPKKHFRCMRDLSVAEVEAAVESLLKKDLIRMAGAKHGTPQENDAKEV